MRKSNGQFARGNSGRPKGSVNKYRKALLEAVTEEDVERIIKKLVEKAVRGNEQCAKMVLDYTAGKPTDHLQVDSNNGFNPVVIKTDKDGD
jgi:hypothetical protein